MKSSHLISIIVPIYNVENYLETCLKSIINQTYEKLEIILINDGSTDRSGEIAQEYAKKDGRIKFLQQENQGLSGARNTGLKKAHGDYVCFVDSDDELKTDMIEYLLSEPADIMICSHYEKFPDGHLTNFNHGHIKHRMDSEQALKEMLLEEGFMVSAWGKLYRAELFKDIEFPVGKVHEDLGTTYKLIMKAKNIVFLPEPKYYYYQRKNSLARESFSERKFDIINLTDLMCDDIDLEYPSLKEITSLRRVHACFSVLRQLPSGHPKQESLVRYLKNHKEDILGNPNASKRDRVALRLALTNPELFKIAYKLAR